MDKMMKDVLRLLNLRWRPSKIRRWWTSVHDGKPPPLLSFEDPRYWWMKLSGARQCIMHPGASDGVQVSVKRRCPKLHHT